MGNRIYGCDDCLAVCPWNRFAAATAEIKLAAREDLVAPPLAELAALDDAAFRQRFSGSPVKPIGRDRFVRNVLVAIGNSGEQALLGAVEPLLADASPLVREAAVWAYPGLPSPVICATSGSGTPPSRTLRSGPSGWRRLRRPTARDRHPVLLRSATRRTLARRLAARGWEIQGHHAQAREGGSSPPWAGACSRSAASGRWPIRPRRWATSPTS